MERRTVPNFISLPAPVSLSACQPQPQPQLHLHHLPNSTSPPRTALVRKDNILIRCHSLLIVLCVISHNLLALFRSTRGSSRLPTLTLDTPLLPQYQAAPQPKFYIFDADHLRANDLGNIYTFENLLQC